MARQRELPHQHRPVFSDWSDAVEAGSLAPSTADCYKTDVARFLRAGGKRNLAECCEQQFLRDYLETLQQRSRRRMTSALSEFFAFCLQTGLLKADPLRLFKYRRGALAVQLDFFDLLTAEGIKERSVRTVSWADFLAPLLAGKGTELRVNGKQVTLRPATWQKLEIEFRRLSARTELKALLERQIA